MSVTLQEFESLLRKTGLKSQNQSLIAEAGIFLSLGIIEEQLKDNVDNSLLQQYRINIEKVRGLILNSIIEAVNAIIENNPQSDIVDALLSNIAEVRIARNQREITAVVKKALINLEEVSSNSYQASNCNTE